MTFVMLPHEIYHFLGDIYHALGFIPLTHLHYVLKSIVLETRNKYTIRVRIWIDEDNGPFLGIGRVILLEKIKETGSITNAAKAIKMSYRQAWQLVNDMNKRSNLPLVEKILGGNKGSNSRLTKEGERVINEFYRVEREIKDVVNSKTNELRL